MKTFEDKLEAWETGRLNLKKQREFERELDAICPTDAELASQKSFGKLLREHMTTSTLSNEDFFNVQILRYIEAEQRARGGRSFFQKLTYRLSFHRPFAALAAALVLIALALFFTSPFPGLEQDLKAGQLAYYVRFHNTKTTTPNISAVPVYLDEVRATVLWLDGLDWIPYEHSVGPVKLD